MACYHRPTHHQKDSSGFAGRGGALGLIDEDSVRAEGANGTMVAAGCWEESVTLSLLDAASQRSPTLASPLALTHSRSPSTFLKQFNIASPGSSRATLASPSSTTPFLSPSSISSPLTPSSISSNLGPATPPSLLDPHQHLPVPTPPRSSSLSNLHNNSNLTTPILSPRKSSNHLGNLWRKGSTSNLTDLAGVEPRKLSDPSFFSTSGSRSKFKVKKGNALGLSKLGGSSEEPIPAIPAGRTFAYKGIEGGPQVAARSRGGSVSGQQGSLSRRFSKSFSNLEHAAASVRGGGSRSSNERNHYGLALNQHDTAIPSLPSSSSSVPLASLFPSLGPISPSTSHTSTYTYGSDSQAEDVPPTPTLTNFRPPAPPPFLGFGIRSSSSDHFDDKPSSSTGSSGGLLGPAQIDQTALFEKVRASLAAKKPALLIPTPSSLLLQAPFEVQDPTSFDDNGLDACSGYGSSERDRQESNASFATSGESSACDAIADDAEIGFAEPRKFDWEGFQGLPIPSAVTTGSISPLNRGSLSLPDDEELQSWLPRKKPPPPPASITNAPSIPPQHRQSSTSSSSSRNSSSSSNHATPTLVSEAVFRSLSLPANALLASTSYRARARPSPPTVSPPSLPASVQPISIEVQVTKATPEKVSVGNGLSTTRTARSDSVGSVLSESSSESSSGSEGLPKAKFEVVADAVTGSWIAVPIEEDEDEEGQEKETSCLSSRPIPLRSQSSSSTLLCPTPHIRSDSGQTISSLSYYTSPSSATAYPAALHLPLTHLRFRSTSTNTQLSLVDSYYFASPSSPHFPRSNGSTPTALNFAHPPPPPPSPPAFSYDDRLWSIRSITNTSSSSSSAGSGSSSSEGDVPDYNEHQMEEDFRKGWGLEGGEEGDLERLERELLGEADDDVVQVDATLFPMPPLRRIWVADGGVVVVVVETDLLERKVEFFPPSGHPPTPRQLIFPYSPPPVPHSIEDRTPLSYRPEQNSQLKRRGSSEAIHHFSTETEEEDDVASEMMRERKASAVNGSKPRRMSLSGWMKRGGGGGEKVTAAATRPTVRT